MIQILLLIVCVGAMVLSVRYSIQSRHGTQHRERNRQVHGKLNMSMGSLLISIALLQLLSPLSTARLIFAGLCLVLGLYNLWSGYRNWKS
jgi:hypothetical protein